jgi:amino acid transporter
MRATAKIPPRGWRCCAASIKRTLPGSDETKGKSHMNGRDNDGHESQGSLGLWSVISIIMGIIIGAGIYETPPDIFRSMPDALTTYGVWAVCGLLALIGALCYAELATTYPRSGGDYVYLTRAYGPMIGYLFGWAQLAVVQTGSIGLMAYIFANYATRLFFLVRPNLAPDLLPDLTPQAPGYLPVGLAAGSVVLMTLVNILGVTLGKWAQNFLTFVKVVGLIGIVVVGFTYPHPVLQPHEGTVVRAESGAVTIKTPAGDERTFPVHADPKKVDAAGKPVPVTRVRIAHSDSVRLEDGKSRPATVADLKPGDEVRVVTTTGGNDALRIEGEHTRLLFGPLMGVLVLVLLTYGGWNDAAFVAAEVRHPERNIPWALILGTLGVTIIYLLVNIAYVNALGFEGAQDTSTIAADVLRLLPEPYGQYAEQLICVLVMISAIGAINGLIFTSSRIYATLGQDYGLFAVLAPGPGGRSPVASLIVQLLFTLLMVLTVGTTQGREFLGEALKYVGQELREQDWVGPGGFLPILKMTAPIFWLFFLMTGLAVFWLRINEPIDRPFPAPLYPITPLIFCAMCAYMLYSGINFAGNLGWVGAILVLAGMPLYVFSRRTAETERT